MIGIRSGLATLIAAVARFDPRLKCTWVMNYQANGVAEAAAQDQ